MDFTLQELHKLKRCVLVYHSDCDRRLRRVRRNRDIIDSRYNSVPKELAEELGFESAESQIKDFVLKKKQAIVLSKKIDLIIEGSSNE